MHGIKAGFVWLAAGVMLCLAASPVAASEPEVRTVVQRGHNAIITDMAFSPDGKLLASLDFNEVVKVWALPGRCLVNTCRFRETARQAGLPVSDKDENRARAVGFTPNGALVVQSRVAQVRLDPGDGKVLSVTHHENYRLSQNGHVECWAVTKNDGVELVITETATGRTIRYIPLKSPEDKAVMSPDGGHVAVYGAIENKLWLKVVEVAGGKVMLDIADASGNGAGIGIDGVLALSPGGKYFAGGMTYGNDDEEELKIIEVDGKKQVFALRGLRDINAFFSTDGKSLAINNGYYDARPYCIDIASMRPLQTTDSIPEVSAGFAFSPDSQLLAWGQRPSSGAVYTSYESHLIGAVDLSTGKIEEFAPQDHIVRAMALSYDGNMLGLAMETNDGYTGNKDDFSDLTQIYSLRDGKLLWTVRQSLGIIGDVTFTPDGKHFVVRGSESISVFDMTNGRMSFQIQLPWFFSNRYGVIAAAPDNTAVYIDGRDEHNPSKEVIGAYSLKTGRLLRTFDGLPKGSDRLCVSQDGRYIAMAGREGMAVMDSASGKVSARLESPGGTLPWPINAAFAPLGFTRDGKKLIDGASIAVLPKGPFSSRTPDLISELKPGVVPTHGVMAALDSARGRLFLARPPDGEIELWDLRRNEPVLRLYPYIFGGVWLTADGYFDIQGKVPDVVRFVRGTGCAGGEEFATRNRPERVKSVIIKIPVPR